MILQALYKLAMQERLVEDPDYEPKFVAYIIRIGPGGKFLGVSPARKTFFVPREKRLTNDDRAFLLFGKAEYVLGLDPDGERLAEKLNSRHALFRKKVEHCYKETNDEAVGAVLAWLEQLDAGTIAREMPDDCASNDLFGFIYTPDEDILVTSRPLVRAHWKSQRGLMVSKNGEPRRCLVTGKEFFGGVPNFPPVKNVPGGSTSGVSFVSFNESAFESHGWSSNENATISLEAAEACSTALSRLLHDAWPRDDDKLPKQYLNLSKDTAVCFWADDPVSKFGASVGGLVEADPSHVEKAYQSIWNGQKHVVDDPARFFALTITGAQGRGFFRGWLESTVAEVSGNLVRHFEDLDICRNCAPGPMGQPPHFSLSSLLKCLWPQGENVKIPGHLVDGLVTAAMTGTQYPFLLLQLALGRASVEAGWDDWIDKDRRDARAALIKAVLNRRFRNENKKEVTRDMDPSNCNTGYVLGRMMAVLEKIQEVSMPGVNASVVDRYFSGAARSPKSVFPRIVINARHHVRKAKSDPETTNRISFLDRLLDEQLAALKNEFPSFLNLENQGMFVLGYHHMRKWLWTNKDDRKKWEQQHDDIPQAYLLNTDN